MPDPQSALNSKEITASDGLTRFDPITGKITHSVPALDNSATALVSREVGYPGLPPKPASTDDLFNPPGKNREGVSELSPSDAIASDITPTPPSPLYYPYTFPFNTEFRLMMRFPVAGFPDKYFLCSASSVSDFHLLSAAHCVYNHDPLEDGSGRGAGFAAEIWAWPAETDVVDPIDHDNWPDFPYGVSKVTSETTYNGWINNSDSNWDFSFLALDRRIGDHVGWMGTEWEVNTTALNFDGYPAEAPYVPKNNPYQYPGFDAGNIIGYTCCRIQMDAYTYGGHSGGGVWRYDGTNDYIEGVNSTSNRMGYAEATLFRSQTHTDLTNIIAADQSAHTPQDLPQLIEYVFNGASKGLVEDSVLIGSSFGLTLNAFNAGYSSAGEVTADIYLTNSEPFLTGIYIGTLTLGNLDAYTYTVQTQYISVPSYVAPGNYFVGWVINGANPQYGTDKNHAIITSQTLQVVSLASLAVTPGSVVGGKSASGTVSLTGAAPQGGVTVGLSVVSGAARFPASVSIPAGASSATFSILTSPVQTDSVTILQATLGGITKSATLAIQPAALANLSLAAASVIGSTTSTGAVLLSGPAPSGGITVALSSSNGNALVPAAVYINAGKSSAKFAITTFPVAARVSLSITATYSGVNRSAILTLTRIVPTSLSVSPSTVTGSHSAMGKVTINSKAPNGGMHLSVVSSNVNVKVPAIVQVKQGATFATFVITTSKVAAKVDATIKATGNGVSKTAMLKVNP